MSGKERLVIKNFHQFGGKHCWTTSLHNLFRFNGLDLSEEMFFGLGGGLGFVYWYMKKMPAPFVGGRQGRGLDPLLKPCEWCGAAVSYSETSSAKKAYDALKDVLRQGKPVVLFVDMAYLPYYVIPQDAPAHFGGHTIIVYGLDENEDKVYVSDRAKGPLMITLNDLKQARASKFPPFPPRHRMLRIDYPAHEVTFQSHILETIRQCCRNMLASPIKNLGLKGIRYWADVVMKWPDQFKGENLFMCLFNTFLFIEVSGTGGGGFRPMYARYLDEASDLLGKSELKEVANDFRKAAAVWSDIALAALPDTWPTLKRIRELMVEKNRVFEEQGAAGYSKMVQVSEKLDKHLIQDKALKEFKSVERKVVITLLENLRERILKLYPIEEQAFGKLQEVVG